MNPPAHQLPEEQLDDLIALYLRATEADRPRLRRQLLAEHIGLAADLQSFFDSQDQFRQLATPLREVFSAQRAHPSGSRVGDYEILEELARGGMGIVYKARSLSLGRIVALKMMRVAPATSAADRQRFRSEAEAVAALDCPNIVPIYEVGEQDQPFFCMKWMPGGSLAQSVVSGQWSVVSRAKQKQAAELMAQVTRAVHHAHTRGILHRDLKPANILLDTDGTLHVSDFGLAKRFDPARQSLDSGDTPSLSSLTQSGLIVGTPSYMAPEQASGKSGTVSVASDVYSLGAILYELLTGRPPCKGETAWDTLRQLMEVEPATVRSLNPGIDRDLETICHKCLHKDPSARYASAAELAADLERYARGEPILARPVGQWERCWRWCQRNPALSAVSALAALALVVVAAGGVWFGLRESAHAQDMELALEDTRRAWKQTEEERDRAENNHKEAKKQKGEAEKNQTEAEKQKQEAEKQKDLADDSFRDAHLAVYKFSNHVGKELNNRPELLTLRQKLLADALDFYKKFLLQRAHDPKLQRELADAYSQVGHISRLLGDMSEAMQSSQKALTIYQKMHQAKPTDDVLCAKLAGEFLNLAGYQHVLAKHEDSLGTYKEGLTLYRQLAHDHPDNSVYAEGLARVSNNMAAVYKEIGEFEKALQIFAEVATERKKQLAANPKNINLKGFVALSINNLGVLQATLGKNEDALKSFQEALELRKDMVAKHPSNAFWQIALAGSYRDVGAIQFDLKNPTEGTKAWTKALELREKMATLHPKVATYQGDLADSYQDFGSLHRKKQEYDQALVYYSKAHTIWDTLCKQDATVPAYLSDKARCDYFLAQVYGLMKKRTEELKHYQLARAAQEKLVQAHPQQLDFHNYLGRTLEGWALALKNGGDWKGAEDNLRLAIQHQKIAFDKAQGVSKYRIALSDHYRDLANVLRAQSKFAEALPLTMERRQLWLKKPNSLFDVAREFANAALLAKERTQIEHHQTLAVETLQMAVAAGFKDGARVRKEPLFQSLQGRADFQAILLKLPK